MAPLLEIAAQMLNCHVDELSWYSWPEVFGSTSGPRGGIGGQAMTTFQVFGFRDPADVGIAYCAGRWVRWKTREMKWPRRT